ncbi:hypothetical protein RRG08_039966 [Elysia crispata]|uniref:Uncharacterized protein n=1 Tax=Elysia crispata TaxID=231223 RepID=A0AAE1DC05_9GAST|nr:hypothetical protein RRG08_039966 [Elysia crispata]
MNSSRSQPLAPGDKLGSGSRHQLLHCDNIMQLPEVVAAVEYARFSSYIIMMFDFHTKLSSLQRGGLDVGVGTYSEVTHRIHPVDVSQDEDLVT